MTPADEWAELEVLAKAATPGNWRAWTPKSRQPEIYTDAPTAKEPNDKIAGGFLRKADAHFSAAANPATILKLIEAARQQPAADGGVSLPMPLAERLMAFVTAHGNIGSGPLRQELERVFASQSGMGGCPARAMGQNRGPVVAQQPWAGRHGTTA